MTVPAPTLVGAHDSLVLTEVYGDLRFLDKLCNQRADTKVKPSHISSAKSIVKRLRGATSSEVRYEVKKYRTKNGETVPIGRFFPFQKGFVTYQNMLGSMARVLSASLYVEVDLKNAHFEILAGNFPQYAAFANYCNNRDAILSSVSESCGCPRWQAKTLFIILIYGGSLQTWKTEFNIPDGAALPPFVPELIGTINAVKGELCDAPFFEKYELAAKFKRAAIGKKRDANDKLWMNTALSFYLQDIERSVVYTAIRYVQDKGAEVSCVKHDGFLVLNADRDKIDLTALSKHCTQVTGQQRMVFDLKELELDDEDLQWKKDVEEGWNDLSVAKDNLSDMTKRIVVAADEGAQAHLAAIFNELLPDTLVYLGKDFGWYFFQQPRWVFAGKNTEFLSNLVMEQLVPIVKAAICEIEEAGLDVKPVKGVLRFLNGRKANLIEELQRLYTVEKPLLWYQALDANFDIFGLDDCVFDIKLGQFRDGTPADMVSLSCGLSSDIVVGDCDTRAIITDTIKSMFKSEAVYDYVMAVLASALSGDRQNQDFNIWSGCGSNGKGLLKTLCRTAFGEYLYEANAAMFFSRSATKSSSAEPDVVKLKGGRLCITSESEKGDSLRVGFLKNCTGGDEIQARNLFSSSFVKFRITSYIVMCFNEIPPFDDSSKGMSRRTRLVDFPFEFVDDPVQENQKAIDRGLQNHFDSQKFGATFLYLLIEQFKDTGLKFDVPEDVTASSLELVNANNSVEELLADFCEAGDETFSVALKDLWDAIPLRRRERDGLKQYSLRRNLSNSGKDVVMRKGYPHLRGFRLNIAGLV